MAQLAIRGNATRGKEVIEILEMLGGKNRCSYFGESESYAFYIIDEIIDCDEIRYLNDYIIYTLEEFLERSPYKVGDKVLYKYDSTPYFIRKMFWENDKILYELSDEVYSDGSSLPDTLIFDVDVKQLQPYKEETMEIPEKLMPKIDFNEYCKDKYILDLGNYEIKEENGKTYAVRKWLEYPKTYEECCRILDNHPNTDYVEGYKWKLMMNSQKLLVCRDAYWKIAGEQMGLGKPWEQDYNDRCFIIANNNGNIHTYEYHGSNNVILAFPTEEMRDAFYENFKYLITKCMKLL